MHVQDADAKDIIPPLTGNLDIQASGRGDELPNCIES